MSNQAIEKLSPFKTLTNEQAQLVDEVILFAKQHLTQDFPAVYTILGDAGTGKSVVLSHLFARLPHLFDDAEKMRQTIVKRNQEVGLSRILSTSGYPSTLDGGKHYICEGDFKMPWDQYNFTATPWAELPQTIDEVGSIYTCQGFDLNYAGIIIGPVISQKPGTNQLQVNLDRFTDTEAFKKRADLTDPDQIIHYEKRMILNALNVILKRGVKGTYLYAHDPLLRQTFFELGQALNS